MVTLLVENTKNIEIYNEDMTMNDVKNILLDFDVKTENELAEKLTDDDWHILKCSRCGNQISLFTCSWDNGDPVCFGGCKNE